MISEVVVNTKQTGFYKDDPTQPIIWGPATGPHADINGQFISEAPDTPAERADAAKKLMAKIDEKGNGVLEAEQYFIFYDKRTETSQDPGQALRIKSSGFSLKQVAEKSDNNKYFIRVTRTALSNHGVDAASNADSTEQVAEVDPSA